MSSPIQVKQELAVPEDILSYIPTDDESEEDICIDNLQLLDPKVASQSKFPVGCKIWYDARKSKASKKLRAKSGCVVGVYFDFQSMKHVYRVKSPADDCEHTVYEDRLMYGINCPVKVTNPDTNEAEDGVIVLPKLDAESDGKQQISYAVQFEEGRHVSVEFLVAAERVVYREVKDNEQVVMNDGIENKTEDVTQEGDALMKEAKVDTNLEQKAAAPKNELGKLPQSPSPSSAAVGTNEVTVNVEEAGTSLAQIATNKLQSKKDSGIAATATLSTRTNQNKESESSYLGTGRWEPPGHEKTPQGKGRDGLERVSSPSERKRSSNSEKSERPSKMVKTDSTCTLTIPNWVVRIRGGKQLFRKCLLLHSFPWRLFFNSHLILCTVHLVGVKNDGSTGHKMKQITGSLVNSKVIISGKCFPMKINILSSSPRNVAQALSMIEESLMEFLSDENSEKKMLHELLSTAEGSYNVKRNDEYRMVCRDKEWWALFELPYHTDSGQYHGKFLTKINLEMPGDCKIELFGDTFGVPLEHASPFVLIRGTKHNDVKDAVSALRDKMRKHQCRRPGEGCNCTPKW